MKLNYLFVIIGLSVLWSSCKDTSTTAATTKAIKQIKQQTIVFDDGSEQRLSDKEIKQVFYLVRHAEKDTIPKDNPGLTEQGEARSVAIADIFRQSRIDEIYSTLYIRTLMTADSLSRSKGMKILPYEPKDLKAFAESIKQKDHIQSAMIVGHSNTTPTLAAFLADKDSKLYPKLDESVYDKLYIVILHKDGTSDVNVLNYFTS